MKYVKWANLNKEEQAVSPVIATILMVAITVVLAGVLVVYMQSFQNVGGGTNVVASISAKTFSNPQDPVTRNGGGWTVEVVSVKSGTLNIADMTVNVKGSSGANLGSLVGATPTLKDTSGTVDYYLFSEALATCDYWSGAAVTADCTGATGNEFNTMENATIVLLDNDASGTLTASDTVLVFKDTNGDGTNDISSQSVVELKAATTKVAQTDLN